MKAAFTRKFAALVAGGTVFALGFGLGGDGTGLISCANNANVDQLLTEVGQASINTFVDPARGVGDDFTNIVVNPVNRLFNNAWGNFVDFSVPLDPRFPGAVVAQ